MVRAQQAHNGCYCEPSSSLLKTLPEQIVLAEFRWTVNAGEEPCEEVDLDGIGDIHALDSLQDILFLSPRNGHIMRLRSIYSREK